MKDHPHLNRFIVAQETEYEKALFQIKQGKKTGHWMWYIFPQISGLGLSETSVYFAIKDMAEVNKYLSHPLLGPRLVEISYELLKLKTNDAELVFGKIDSLKLQSSMTLFSMAEKPSPVFQLVLDKFFDGKKDLNTIRIANK